MSILNLPPKILYVVTDTSIQKQYSHIELMELALQGGASMIQLRDKQMEARELFATAVAMNAFCSAFGIPFIVNDRLDIAMACNASGVHLGQHDIPIPIARKLFGHNKIIGGSASTLEEAIDVEKNGADYIGFGHIYATRTKSKPYHPRGLDVLKQVCSAVKIPVVAIGGITLQNATDVIKSGANGIAVVSAICKSPTPNEATKNFYKLLHTNYSS